MGNVSTDKRERRTIMTLQRDIEEKINEAVDDDELYDILVDLVTLVDENKKSVTNIKRMVMQEVTELVYGKLGDE